MLPSPAPKYFLLGAILSTFGALVFLFRGRRRGKGRPRPWLSIVAGGLAIALGIVVIGTGISTDLAYNAGLHATTLSYQVSLQMNGSWPVRILLPAPSDARLFDALNATNGTASLRLNHAAADTNVVLAAQGNVTFLIRAQVPTAAVGRNFTRLTSCSLGQEGLQCNATIELEGAPAGLKVHLTLLANIGVPCEWHLLSLESWISEGAAGYAASAGTAVC